MHSTHGFDAGPTTSPDAAVTSALTVSTADEKTSVLKVEAIVEAELDSIAATGLTSRLRVHSSKLHWSWQIL